MRKAVLIALLGMAVLAMASKSQNRDQGKNRYDDNDDDRQQQEAKPFRAGNEYTFTYNTQVATGMVAPDVSAEPGMPQQKAVTRMQAQARIQFSSDRHATLELDQIRLGELNDQMPQPDTVKPLRMFEPKQIPQEKYRQLQLTTQFIYADGVIERIQFHQQDETWSKNIKRAVLNMIQLNLKKNNAQGLRQAEDLQLDGQEETTQPGEAESFVLPEITIEGECQTLYSVGEQNESNGRFNVTKSVNFQRCRKISDVAYGFQTQQQQPQCAQCQQEWYKQQQQERKPEDRQPQQPHPCDQCDPKEVKEQRLSRATVLRFVLNGDQKQHAIQRTELTSQYVLKNLNAEAGQYGSAMHAIVASELIFRSVHQKSQPSGAQQRQSSDKEETLLFSNQWNVDVKRFYMYGDEEYSRNSPFRDVQNKVQQAEQALRKLAQSAESNQNGGIEIEVPIQLQRLVETLRMCSQEELKQIDRAVSNQQRNNNNGNSEKQTAEQFFIDALAIAGTRNTIATLVEKILAKEMSEAKAAQTLKSLQGLPAPSDAQVKMVERLCQSEVAHRSPALKQSCWLTLGNMINELCQHKTQKLAQQSIFGTQSGFTSDEVCPQDKKQKYREVLAQQFKNADNTYEKVLALKALGNAGIENMINDIEEIITNPQEERVVRAVAIDALRRMRTQMPRKIQSILMPLFQNNREQPEIRMVAFAVMMNTMPNQQVIDQIAYALTQERSQHVLAFVYNSLKTLSKTQNPMKQEIAKHVQNALKLLNVDDKALKSMSGRTQFAIYSQEQNEGVFIDLVAAFSAKAQLPWYIAAELNSVLNNEYQNNDLKLAFAQQNIEQLYGKLQAAFQQTINAYNKPLTRGQRNQEQQSSTLRDIYSTLGIKSRRSSMYNREDSHRNQRQQDQEQPFAMFNLRIKDVDMAIIPASDKNGPQALKAILNGEKFSLNQILGANKQLNGQHVRKVMATNFNENRAYIATSAGLPLKAQQSTPVIATLEAQAEVNAESSSLSSPLGVKAQVKAQASLNVAHIQKLECWLPIFSTGTASIRSLELNLPVNAEVSVNSAHGLQVKIKVPQNKKIQVLGLHTLPTTYTAEFDQNKKVSREPKIKAIHNPQIDESQREVNTVIGRSAGLPFHVRGHYYRPSKPSSYKQLVQMLMAAENQIHITFEPSQQTPREVILRVQGTHFEKIQSQQPELNNFYSKRNNNRDRFSSSEDSKADFEDDNDFVGMESHNQRSQKLNSYLNGQYRAGQMYRHALKMSAQTVGGEKECKAQMEIQGACDAKFKFCKVNVEADRTPLENENNKWTLKAEAQILTPESVSSVDQLDQLESRNQKFLAQAEAQWGANNKQHVNVRIEGEQAKKAQWSQIEQKEQRRNKYYKRQTSFLNKYEVEAEYKLQPAAQNMVNRVFEVLKANNYWNSQVQLNNNQQKRDQQQGQMKAIVVIDPITQRHANVTVRTPNQAVRIESMELPGQFRPFALIRPDDKSSHSAQQLFNRWTMGKRAECTADGRTVNTFDNVEYNAPISKCYSVLAKDCSGEDPRFVVLMKALNNYNGKQQQQQQKKVKVITPEQSIECQPANKNSQKLQCRVNGQQADEHNNDAEDQTIEYNNDQKTDVTINVEGLSVRFNGKKAWIKISSQYKNGQCGLCGHYDDEQADEWRMNNNELTEDLAKFHRSYSLQQDDECTQDDQKDFYEQNKKSFNRRRRTSSSESDEDKSSSESNEDESQEWDDQSFNGDDYFSAGRRSNSQRRNQQNQNGRNQMDRRSRKEQTRPEEQTAVMEMGSTKICFSMEPVKQCPRGTYPANEQDSDFGYGSSNEQSQQRNQKREKKDDKQGGSKKVKFACLNRSSEEARRLLREVRRGEVLDMSEHKPTMTEQVQQPQKCRRY